MTEHPSSNLIDIFAVLLEGFSFKPSIHVNYESKTVSVKDGLPKFKELPKEFNGSGEILPEWIFKFYLNKKLLSPLNHSVMIIQDMKR